jgi:hypothetical protein
MLSRTAIQAPGGWASDREPAKRSCVRPRQSRVPTVFASGDRETGERPSLRTTEIVDFIRAGTVIFGQGRSMLLPSQAACDPARYAQRSRWEEKASPRLVAGGARKRFWVHGQKWLCHSVACWGLAGAPLTCQHREM